MTDELNDILSDRAARARTPQDPDAVLAVTAALAERRSRRRRNRLAIASGTAVVVAAATLGLAIAEPGGGTTGSARQQAGDTVNAGPSSGRSAATELPVVSPLHGSSSGGGLSIRSLAARREVERERAKAAARQQRLQQLRAKRAARAARHTTLVPVDPAPKQAEISIGYVPQGFQYLSHDDANTYYGPAGLPPSDYFSKGIVVDVHQFFGSSKGYTLTVNGMPAAYYHSADTDTVRVRYSKQVDVGFQAPAGMTEAQALQIASSIDVRSTKHRTHG